MLGRNGIFGRVAHGGGRKCLFGIAARLLRRIGGKRPGALRVQIGDVRLLLVFDPDLRGGDTRGLPIFRQHQRDRLTGEKDPVVVERTIGRAVLRRDFVLVGVVLVGHWRPVLMGEHVDHTVDVQRPAGVDAHDPPLWNSRFDDIAMDEAGDVELAGIFGRAGDLGPAVDAGCR